MQGSFVDQGYGAVSCIAAAEVGSSVGEKMGVGKGFWDQLRPLARSEDSSFLRGKRLAIDLSFWLVQQQTALKDQHVRKPHLRLTFYRVVKLVSKVGALPVFVVDGEPPLLKQGVRMKRFKRFAEICPSLLETPTGQESNTPRKGIFHENVEDCVTLLELLGVPVLRATGEAESLCAALNREGLVDACVSPDSDAFVHGAKWVIKTLQLENGNKGPEVELYSADDIEASMGLRRKHLLALALLVGCDYSPEGVAGVGCTHALRLISCFRESEILDRLRAWGRGELPPEVEVDQGMDARPGIETVESVSENLSRVTHCSKCGHPGNKKDHATSGCQPCISSSEDEFSIMADCKEKVKSFRCTCLFCIRRAQKRVRVKSNEWWSKMCHKMASTPGFPDEEIINLFLSSEIASAEDIRNYTTSLTWRAPVMEELEIFLQKHLHWDPFYVRQKVLPLLSHFYLTELATMRNSTPSCSPLENFLNGAYAPLCIHRMKIEQGEPLYRLKWKSMKEGLDGQEWLGLKLKPTVSKKIKRQKTRETETTDMGDVEFPETDGKETPWCFTTDENTELLKAAIPDIVEKFDREQETKQAIRIKAKKEKVEGNESGKRLSTITSYFNQQKEVPPKRLAAPTVYDTTSIQEFPPHTPRRTATRPGCVDTESLIVCLNSKSLSTTFSLVSPAPVPGTPKRTISKKVARRLSLEGGL